MCDEFIFSFDFGTIGYNIFLSGSSDIHLNISSINLSVESNTSGIGIEFIPINYSYSLLNYIHTFNLSAIGIYWDFDKIYRRLKGYDTDEWEWEWDRSFGGPFVSIQPLNTNNFKDYNFNKDIIISAGLKFAVRVSDWGLKNMTCAWNSEVGYRYYNGMHGVFIATNISYALAVFLPIILK